MTKNQAREHYSSLRRAGKLTGTIKDAVKTWEKRHERKPSVYKFREQKILILLSSVHVNEANRIAKNDHPLRKDWNYPEPGTITRVEVIDNGRYSSRCTYTHYTYTPLYRSWGKCTAGHLIAFVGPNHYRMTPPAGCKFGTDGYGMYVVRIRHAHRKFFRYHFESADLANKSTLRSALKQHEKKQRDAIKSDRESNLRKGIRSDVIGNGLVYVGFRDSITAGNCAAGTKAFCDHHGLDARNWYPLQAVIRFQKYDSRIKRVINAAIDRTVADIQRGYCQVD